MVCESFVCEWLPERFPVYGKYGGAGMTSIIVVVCGFIMLVGLAEMVLVVVGTILKSLLDQD